MDGQNSDLSMQSTDGKMPVLATVLRVLTIPVLGIALWLGLSLSSDLGDKPVEPPFLIPFFAALPISVLFWIYPVKALQRPVVYIPVTFLLILLLTVGPIELAGLLSGNYHFLESFEGFGWLIIFICLPVTLVVVGSICLIASKPTAFSILWGILVLVGLFVGTFFYLILIAFAF